MSEDQSNISIEENEYTRNSILSCPVCQLTLERTAKNLRCENNHSYDQAKQGYFNLLMNTAKKSKQPGDNLAMVQARTGFLNAGHYQGISDALNQIAIDQLWQKPHSNILDLGCGEGYYSERLHYALSDHQIDHDLHALDISKDAVKAACRRTKDINWLVANAVHAPFNKHSMDLIINVFNRIQPEALHNLSSNNGRVIIASAGAHHLKQLKEAIYETPKFVEFDAIGAMSEFFEHEKRLPLEYTIKLDPQSTQHLLGMTPHAWRCSPETQASLLNQDELELKVQINIDSFKRKPLNPVNPWG